MSEEIRVEGVPLGALVEALRHALSPTAKKYPVRLTSTYMEVTDSVRVHRVPAPWATDVDWKGIDVQQEELRSLYLRLRNSSEKGASGLGPFSTRRVTVVLGETTVRMDLEDALPRERRGAQILHAASMGFAYPGAAIEALLAQYPLARAYVSSRQLWAAYEAVQEAQEELRAIRDRMLQALVGPAFPVNDAEKMIRVCLQPRFYAQGPGEAPLFSLDLVVVGKSGLTEGGQQVLTTLQTLHQCFAIPVVEDDYDVPGELLGRDFHTYKGLSEDFLHDALTLVGGTPDGPDELVCLLAYANGTEGSDSASLRVTRWTLSNSHRAHAAIACLIL